VSVFENGLERYIGQMSPRRQSDFDHSPRSFSSPLIPPGLRGASAGNGLLSELKSMGSCRTS